ncbi:histidinol dehydrogenase [Kineosporia succinea]|uniref:Histidinol dehydrogenase n=1 Tax=Kineosporia succinea TaxID=84632 RepID=A0ABT9PDW6_9ACTN|nr:histidinol dehydrogenase [Kineosporia succinea]MDP9830686.1 histidinol dehydrogenase [Kineosporia succinea]
MADTGVLRERGYWHEMDLPSRADLTTRGSAAIFDPKLREGILELLEDVRAHGDAAVLRALEKFDKTVITADQIKVSEAEFAAARSEISEDMIEAIRDSIAHVRSFNEQLVSHHGDWSFESEPGLRVGEKASPIASAGLFVPSGKGSYPSVLIQLAVPAVVAGVPQIAVVVPPIPGSNGKVDPAVLVAADELGIHDVFRTNGPAGIAALAFGTESIPAVRKICGPGSPPVTAAQVEVQRFGVASVMLLGPSESLILADDSADPRLLAADLLNEAEHGPDSTSVLVTDSTSLLAAVQAELATQIDRLPTPRDEYAATALGTNGGVVLVRDLVEGAQVANAFAPEHMQLVARDEDRVLDLLHDAAEILLGQNTTVAMANFFIGCPASLPTSGYAKVSSGVTANAFRKWSAVAKADRGALERSAKTVLTFCEHEGFPAHGATITARTAP